MRELPVIEDKRLLGALDYIDEKYIAEVTESYKVFGESDGKISVRRAVKTSVKQIAILAACAMLLSLAVPIVSYIVPQMGEMFGGNAGNIGEPETLDKEGFADMSERDLIEHIGEVPEEFAEIINQNLFKNICVSGDKIIKASSDDKYNIEVYDLYGNLLHKIKYKFEPAGGNLSYRNNIHALSDGNYMMIIPHTTYYVISGPGQSEQREVEARAIKFNKNGRAIFDTLLETKCGEFEYFFEIDSGYLLIGGSYQKRDRYFLKLDKHGNLTDNLKGGSSEHDRLYHAEYGEDGLVMYLRDFARSGYDILRQRYSDDYALLESEKYDSDKPYTEFYQLPSGHWNVRNFVLGYNPGHKDDPEMPMLGYVSSVIEYDDFILIVSERDTKWFEYVPMIYSSIPSYTETVYSAYTYDGELIWRSSVDSTDYERLAEIKKAYEEEQDRFNK